MKERVAIILVNWNSFKLTNDCILSLKKIDYKYSDIILVDNGSADGSGEQLKKDHPEIVFIKSIVNTGFTGGNNLGLQYSLDNGYTYSLLLNNDTLTEPDFLTQLVEYMNEHPDTGAIQPRIFFNHNRTLLWNAGSYYSRFWGYTYTEGYNRVSNTDDEKIKEVDWITGCAFLTRNSILEKIGLLKEKYFIYYEDVDLSFRIKNEGYKLIYYPESVIYHIAGMANKNAVKGKEGFLNPVVHYLNVRNSIWLIKTYTPWHLSPGVIIYNFFHNIALIIYFALRFRFKKLAAVLKGIKDGLMQP